MYQLNGCETPAQLRVRQCVQLSVYRCMSTLSFKW